VGNVQVATSGLGTAGQVSVAKPSADSEWLGYGIMGLMGHQGR